MKFRQGTLSFDQTELIGYKGKRKYVKSTEFKPRSRPMQSIGRRTRKPLNTIQMMKMTKATPNSSPVNNASHGVERSFLVKMVSYQIARCVSTRRSQQLLMSN